MYMATRTTKQFYTITCISDNCFADNRCVSKSTKREIAIGRIGTPCVHQAQNIAPPCNQWFRCRICHVSPHRMDEWMPLLSSDRQPRCRIWQLARWIYENTSENACGKRKILISKILICYHCWWVSYRSLVWFIEINNLLNNIQCGTL